MPRRPALTTATAALCALTALTACQGSPEAGQPNTTPTTTSAASTPTPTPVNPSTPGWTPAEKAAIAAAKARYMSARAAIDVALNDPAAATDAKLLQAGTGGAWLVRVLTDVQFNLDRGWYQNGRLAVAILSVASVKLKAEQPEVRLNVCLDTSKVGLYYKKTHKPVPGIPANGNRHKIQAQVVYASLDGQSTKMWFLIDEKDLGSC
ncbi:hypothetical protein EV137_1898 [Kribbella pratensis]|uniref:Lipoprotein n=1 Tax=Kribbella pratensis TaxID=2512112 RepID=A0ABY2FN69_9ACTN|nr:hypothetical protein [Kribbella pratensis]TDW94581.1 hypothetical protein EV137_1898 [Kribbella pratensis]